MGGKSSTSAVSATSLNTFTSTTATTITPITAATAPTPTITSIAPPTKTTPVSTEGASKPTFYSIVTQLTSDADKAKSIATSAVTRWYNWTKFEQQTRDKGKVLWYMKPPVTSTDTPSTVATTLTMTTAKINNDQKETSDLSNIIAIPSFQLRSTAVYSPPHGDRVLSGRHESTDTDISNFKYYLPANRSQSQQTVGKHTKATMYRMNTLLKQTLLPNQLSSLATTNSYNGTNLTHDKFVSRDPQTNLETQPINSSSTQTRYYEKQQSQAAFSNYNSNNTGFYHLTSDDPSYKPILPPVGKTPVSSNNDQPYPSLVFNPPTSPASILKKPSTVLSPESSNPLSKQTHGKLLEELRKHNKNAKDGTYRVKKTQPSTVSFNLPPSTKASQSILRSERLFFSQLFNRKK